MGPRAFVRRHVGAAVDLLWPPFCPRCGARAGRACERFCEACWGGLRPLARQAGQGCLAAFAVDPLFLDLLTTAKYRRSRAVSRRLSAAAAARVAPWLPGAAVLVPVPLTSAKRRERGFNQSEDFAAALALRVGAPVRENCLVRCRGGAALAGRARAARARAVHGAFVAGPGLAAECESTLVLVDDVVTTGATSGECVRALLEGGARGPVVVAAMGRAFASAADARPSDRDSLGRL